MTTTSVGQAVPKEYNSEAVGRDQKTARPPAASDKTELLLAICCGVCLSSGFGLSFVPIPIHFPIILYGLAYLSGGYYAVKQSAGGIRRRRFEIDFLMLVAAIGAAALGRWAEGALLLFLFSLGHSLEHYALGRAKKSIAALAACTPKTALLKMGDVIREVKPDELKKGDIILVKPNTNIAADGIVVRGYSSVNQAPITGESIPADKAPVENLDVEVEHIDQLDEKHKVFAGSLNGEGNLEIRVSTVATDSTLARLIRLVNEAQTQKSPTQHFTDKLQQYYVPAVLMIVVVLLFAFLVINEPFSRSFYRAMAVLVAASPCALAISTPGAVLSGVARAARSGVLIKGGRPLEELGLLKAIAFDKTGTLTVGKPKLTGVYPLNGVTEDQLLETVVPVEKLSAHPLAVAAVNGGKQRLKRDVPAAAEVEAIQGRGLRAVHRGSIVFIGNKQLFAERSEEPNSAIKEKMEVLEKQGNTTMLVRRDDTFIGIITLMDIARSEAGNTLQRLREMGMRQIVMLTGDNQQVAEAIGREIGITTYSGNLLPEQKAHAVEQLRKSEGSVAMVGDGVNDAPAMACSTLGIAMGAAGADVALETADVALLSDNLTNLPFAIALGRKANRIIKQNVAISLGMILILVPLTMSGLIPMGVAVIGHEGSTLIVVLNALRLLAFRKKS